MVKIYKIFTNTILILLIVILGCYAFLRFTNRVEIYSVKTGSMEENIHVGDYVLIYKKSNYNVGDVVTYQKDDYFITHRIIKIDDNQIITKGDANNTVDEKIALDDIIGKVIMSGGILNIIVNYKFAIAAIFIALYLLSCYFGDGNEETEDNQEMDTDDPVTDEDEQDQSNDEISETVSDTENITEEDSEIKLEEDKKIEEDIGENKEEENNINTDELDKKEVSKKKKNNKKKK